LVTVPPVKFESAMNPPLAKSGEPVRFVIERQKLSGALQLVLPVPSH
jgi:hypothetical protein